MDYYQFQIKTTESSTDKEIILAFIQQLDFDTFEDVSDGIYAYVPDKSVDDQFIESLNAYAKQFSFSFEQVFIKSQNWNAVWESNFQTIVVNDFCGIRADFHAPIPNVAHEIIISPKMAFGTGHHATTYMVMEVMESIEFRSTKVLDYGCGTGILAVLASMLGASKIDAVDIEAPAYENTIENAQINQIENIYAYHGTLAKIEDTSYEVILANINRNVILESLSTLYQKLKKGGHLIISGFLVADRELLRNAVENEGFTVLDVKERNNWLCILLHR